MRQLLDQKFECNIGEMNEMTKQNPKIHAAYICNRLFCNSVGYCNNKECAHTTDYEYALFKGLPQTFIKLDENRYYEVKY